MDRLLRLISILVFAAVLVNPAFAKDVKVVDDEANPKLERYEQLLTDFEATGTRAEDTLVATLLALETRYKTDLATLKKEFDLLTRGLAKSPDNDLLYAKAKSRLTEIQKLNTELDEVQKVLKPYVHSARSRNQVFGTGRR